MSEGLSTARESAHATPETATERIGSTEANSAKPEVVRVSAQATETDRIQEPKKKTILSPNHNDENWLEHFMHQEPKPLDIMAGTFTVGAAAFSLYVLFEEPILSAAALLIGLIRNSKLAMAIVGYTISFGRKSMHQAAGKAVQERWEIFQRRWLRKKPKKKEETTQDEPATA